MAPRKPQINFQVEASLKQLYDEANAAGYRGARLCAAGLLLMIEDAVLRRQALDRLRSWEVESAKVSRHTLRTFVHGAACVAPPHSPATGSSPSQR